MSLRLPHRQINCQNNFLFSFYILFILGRYIQLIDHRIKFLALKSDLTCFSLLSYIIGIINEYLVERLEPRDVDLLKSYVAHVGKELFYTNPQLKTERPCRLCSFHQFQDIFRNPMCH